MIKIAGSLTVDAEVLGRISAVGCRSGWLRKPGEVPRRIALQELRMAAAGIGATGLYDLRYTPAPIANGCGMKDGVKVTGIAFRRVDSR